MSAVHHKSDTFSALTIRVSYQFTNRCWIEEGWEKNWPSHIDEDLTPGRRLDRSCPFTMNDMSPEVPYSRPSSVCQSPPSRRLRRHPLFDAHETTSTAACPSPNAHYRLWLSGDLQFLWDFILCQQNVWRNYKKKKNLTKNPKSAGNWLKSPNSVIRTALKG